MIFRQLIGSKARYTHAEQLVIRRDDGVVLNKRSGGPEDDDGAVCRKR